MTRTAGRPAVATIGLDISLTSAGIAVIPPRWCPGDWHNVATMAFGRGLPKDASEKERVERCVDIATRLQVFASTVVDLAARNHGAVDIAIEQYAFSRMLSQAHRLGEVGGLVKVFMMRTFPEASLDAVVASSARKFLFGKLPAKNIKKAVIAGLRSAGCPFTTEDEMDAFVVANYARSTRGLKAMSLA